MSIAIDAGIQIVDSTEIEYLDDGVNAALADWSISCCTCSCSCCC